MTLREEEEENQHLAEEHEWRRQEQERVAAWEESEEWNKAHPAEQTETVEKREPMDMDDIPF